MAHQTFLTQSAGSQNRYRDCLGISIRAGIFRIDLVAGFVAGPERRAIAGTELVAERGEFELSGDFSKRSVSHLNTSGSDGCSPGRGGQKGSRATDRASQIAAIDLFVRLSFNLLYG